MSHPNPMPSPIAYHPMYHPTSWPISCPIPMPHSRPIVSSMHITSKAVSHPISGMCNNMSHLTSRHLFHFMSHLSPNSCSIWVLSLYPINISSHDRSMSHHVLYQASPILHFMVNHILHVCPISCPVLYSILCLFSSAVSPLIPHQIPCPVLCPINIEPTCHPT